MKKFNGDFFIDEGNIKMKTVLSIQYQGNGDWSLKVCSKLEKCGTYCRLGKCRKNPKNFPEIVLNEKKTSASLIANMKGLLAIGMFDDDYAGSGTPSARDKQAVLLQIEVEEDNESNSGILRIGRGTGESGTHCKVLMGNSSEDRSVKVTHIYGSWLATSWLAELEGGFVVFICVLVV